VCQQRVHSLWRILRVNQRRLDEKSTLFILICLRVYRSHIIAVGSWDKTLSVFDVNTLQLVHHIIGHANGVDCVCFSNDDKLIASASYDNTILVWSVSTSEVTHRLKGHTNWVYCVCFSNGDKLIASGSADRTIIVWSVSTGEVTHRLKGHTQSVYCVCFFNEDQLIASASHDKTVIVWSVSTGEVIHRFTGHTRWVQYVCFSNDDYYLWSEAYSSKTRVFEVISGKCVSEEKPLWAVKNERQSGKSADRRIEYSLDTDFHRNGHKIIIEVVEGDKESTKSVESKTAAKVCVDWSIFPKNCLEVFFRLLRQHNNCIHSFANVSTEVSTRA
jgi:WD40 repeat protein